MTNEWAFARPAGRSAITIAAAVIAFCISTSVIAQTDQEIRLPESAAAPHTPAEPQPELARPTVWGEPTEVRVGVYIIDVDSIDSAEQSFSASVYLEARWNIPALRHDGPAPLHRPWTQVWTPRLAIVNGQAAWRAFPETVEILPSGEVIYRQKVWGQFSQPLDLREFPQDRQTLTVQVAAAGLSPADVKMVELVRGGGQRSGIADVFSLPDVRIASCVAGPEAYPVAGTAASVAGFSMTVTVERRFAYYVIKVILPLCLIVAISWIPRWLDPAELGVNLGLGATAFLTLSAYLFAVSTMLPPVSYITHLDRFILLIMLLVFAALVHSAWAAILVRRGRHERAQLIDYWARAMYPVALLIVIAIAFAF